ncbi:MAG: alpha/beta hydrolase [Planctomycetota bacterium]|jgi:fermentation-respiration switch protein FrsA (DUF1100 family)
MSGSHGDRWFYHPTREAYVQPEEIEQTFEDVFFDSESETLHGWFFPGQGPIKGTIVHCHGMGGNITGHHRFVCWLPDLGWNLLVFDYRGFGRSSGRPSRAGTVADAHAAINYAAGRADVDTGRLLLFGQSLGASVAVVVASAREELAGVVLEGVFANYRDEAQFFCRNIWWLWGVAPFARWMVSEGLDPMDHVDGLNSVPKMFITGSADHVCDPKDTVALHDAAAGPKSLWIIEGGNHLGALGQTEGEGPRRVEAFFSKCVGAAPAEIPTDT